jgi:hypothetical protein
MKKIDFKRLLTARHFIPLALPFCIANSFLAIAAPSKKANSTAQASIPTSLHATMSGAHPTFVDPKTGATLWTADVQSAEATTSATGQLMGAMYGVTGVFYEKGKPGDHFSAAKVSYDDQNKTVTATGGVRIRSLTQNSTTLSCDRVVWYPSTNKLVGDGNVVLRSGHFVQTGPKFQADTKLKDVIMRRTASQGVHLQYQP